MTVTTRFGLVAALFATTLAACSGGKDGGSNPPPTGLADVVTKVEIAGVTATQVCTPLPAVGAGPAVSTTAPAAVLPGGSAFYELSAGTNFDQVILAVSGLDCYWSVPVVPGPNATAVVTIGQSAPATFTLVLGVASGSVAGPREEVPVMLTQVGTGAVQVSVTWDAESDVDLHLVEPGGEEIYYGNDTSLAGGVLDLDSNAGCDIDGKKNENITYTMPPPRGTYTVRVDYWDYCDEPVTNYVVTLTVGGTTQTFSGQFTGPGDQGSEGDGVLVTTFTY